MKFNSKHIFLLILILFFIWIIIRHLFSLPKVIYREGLQVNGRDVSGTQIPIQASINETSLTLLDKPQIAIRNGDILLTNNGNVIKSITGKPIIIEIGDGLTYSLSDTPTDVTFQKVMEYIIFSLDNGEKNEEKVSTQYNVNGKIDTNMNFVLNSSPEVDFAPGSFVLFGNGDNVKDNSNNPITIVSGSGALYALSRLPNPDYNLYDTPIDYIVEVQSSSSSE
jgi:hypothetical protein